MRFLGVFKSVSWADVSPIERRNDNGNIAGDLVHY